MNLKSVLSSFYRNAKMYENTDPKLYEISLNIIETFISSLKDLLKPPISDADYRIIKSKKFYSLFSDYIKNPEDKKPLNVQLPEFFEPMFKSFSDMGFKGDEKYLKNKKLPNHGGIMYGPPGNGKTFMWEKIQQVFKGCYFTEISASEVQSKGLGSSIEAIDKKRIEIEIGITKSKYPFAIMFFDEIDILRQRSSIEQTGSYDGGVATTSHFLKQIGSDATQKIPSSFILGATNFIDRVDDAVARSGRLGYRYFFGRPSRDDIYRISKDILLGASSSTNVKIDDDVYRFIADLGNGIMNYSDIKPVSLTIAPKSYKLYPIVSEKAKNITLNEKVKNTIRNAISSLSDDLYTSIKLSKILSNIEIDKTKKITDIIFSKINIKLELLKNGKIIFEIEGKRQIGKTTLAFRIVDYIIKNYSNEFGFSSLNYESKTAIVDSSSPYEKSSSLEYKFYIDDEVYIKSYEADTDMVIIIKVIQNEDVQDPIPTVRLNGYKIDISDV